jgi:hypothetical protein
MLVRWMLVQWMLVHHPQSRRTAATSNADSAGAIIIVLTTSSATSVLTLARNPTSVRSATRASPVRKISLSVFIPSLQLVTHLTNSVTS